MQEKIKKIICYMMSSSKIQKVFILLFAFNVFSWGKWMKIFSFGYMPGQNFLSGVSGHGVFVFYERMIFWALNLVCILGFFLFAKKETLEKEKSPKRKPKAKTSADKK